MAMKIQPTVVMIQDLDDVSEVLAAMADAARKGRGWVNVQSEPVDETEVPPTSALTQFFRRNTPDLALGTWTPPDPQRPGSPQSLGVQHRLGAKLLPLFDDFGIERPDTWRRLQDSPRRGLVVEVPADHPHDEALRWLLRVIRSATPVATTGRYRVVLNRSTTT